jgi:rhodanese-related sulfurtransferase
MSGRLGDCRHTLVAAGAAIAVMISGQANAGAVSPAFEEMAAYLDFVEYPGGTIFAEQIPEASYANTLFVDTRDAAQFLQGHIPHAVNIEWRRILAESDHIPKNKLVVLYCNTGSLSSQAGFALRVAGWDNVRILHGGYDDWTAKGGVEAYARAAAERVKTRAN